MKTATEYWKDKNEVIKLGNGFIEVNGKKYKDAFSRYVLTPKQYKEIKDLKELLKVCPILSPDDEEKTDWILKKHKLLNNQ